MFMLVYSFESQHCFRCLLWLLTKKARRCQQAQREAHKTQNTLRRELVVVVDCLCHLVPYLLTVPHLIPCTLVQ
jgi:hypothetical protein